LQPLYLDQHLTSAERLEIIEDNFFMNSGAFMEVRTMGLFASFECGGWADRLLTRFLPMTRCWLSMLRDWRSAPDRATACPLRANSQYFDQQQNSIRAG
jgi:hypothetical protein